MKFFSRDPYYVQAHIVIEAAGTKKGVLISTPEFSFTLIKLYQETSMVFVLSCSFLAK